MNRLLNAPLLFLLLPCPLMALDTLKLDISNHPEDRLFISNPGYYFRSMDDNEIFLADVHYLIYGGDFDPQRGDCSTDVFVDNYSRPVTFHNAHIYNLRYNNTSAQPQTVFFRGYNQVIRFGQQAMYLYTDTRGTPRWHLSGDSLYAETHDELYRMAALAAGGSNAGVWCIDLDMDYIDLRGTNGGIGTRDGADIDTVRVRRGTVSCCGIDRSLHQTRQLVIHTGASFKAALLEKGSWSFVTPGNDTWGAASLIPFGSSNYQIRPVNELGIRLHCVRVPHSGGFSVSVDNDYKVRTWTFSAHHPQDPCFYLWLPAGDYLITTPAGLRRYIELEDNDIDLLPFDPSPPSPPDALLPPLEGSGAQWDPPSGRWDIYTLAGKWIEGGTSPLTPSPSSGIYILKEASRSRILLTR